jgi:hypothetical protein
MATECAACGAKTITSWTLKTPLCGNRVPQLFLMAMNAVGSDSAGSKTTAWPPDFVSSISPGSKARSAAVRTPFGVAAKNDANLSHRLSDSQKARTGDRPCSRSIATLALNSPGTRSRTCKRGRWS